jgi:hypothetical protein
MASNQLTQAETAALAYWPQIEYAARSGLNTADLWATIRDAAEELGLSSPGVTIQGVSGLRSRAVAIQRREETFAGLADSKRLTGRDVGTAPWSRSPGERRALPKFQVRFEHTFNQAGEQRTEWRTALFEGKLPRTAGELRALVEGDAVQLGNKYGVEHIGIDSLQLLAV